jgi:type IV fimbrial biogenesis protein FimT
VAVTEVEAGTTTEVGTPVFTDRLAFNGLGGVTSATLAAGSEAAFNITNPAGGVCAAADEDGTMRCLRVLVTQGGQIRMCDPALTISKPGDPQAC